MYTLAELVAAMAPSKKQNYSIKKEKQACLPYTRDDVC
jgi:hypothetical protein